MGTTEEKNTGEVSEVGRQPLTPEERQLLTKYLVSRYAGEKNGGDYYAVPIVALLIVLLLYRGALGLSLIPFVVVIIGTIQLAVGLMWRKKISSLGKDFRASFVVSVILTLVMSALSVVVILLFADVFTKGPEPPDWLVYVLLAAAGALAIARIRLYQTAMVKITYRFFEEASKKWNDYRDKCTALIWLVLIVALIGAGTMLLMYSSVTNLHADNLLEAFAESFSAAIALGFLLITEIVCFAVALLVFNLLTRKMETAAARLTLSLLTEPEEEPAEEKPAEAKLY